jgi:hypothetical protein
MSLNYILPYSLLSAGVIGMHPTKEGVRYEKRKIGVTMTILEYIITYIQLFL